jgi:Fe-S oxidoreductase
MKFDIFVLPFSIGLIILFAILSIKIKNWYKAFSADEKKLIKSGIFSRKIFPAIGEIVMEGLFHRRIFKVNPVLGFMHMSFAFGWFMLIAIGNLESRLHSGSELNLPFYPIFFKFFVQDKSNILAAGLFTFLMDFFLLLIISGLLIAIVKRFYSRLTGIKKATSHVLGDKLAITALWFIFPLRFFAESFTSGFTHTGGFFTGTTGNLLFDVFGQNSQHIAYFFWWSYSWALGLFFIALPFSRYLHIPTEIFLISLRHLGIKPTKTFGAFSQVEVSSCPRCGVCIDTCQISKDLSINTIQSVYLLRGIRQEKLSDETAFNCLVCGRCEEICPVGINLNTIRLQKRDEKRQDINHSLDYLVAEPQPAAEVLYFAGCMSHLTPGIKRAMVQILEKSGAKYRFMDENGGVCCGRPMMLAGKRETANKMVEVNREMIKSSGAGLLVTSCPICYKVFKEEYQLEIPVLHHTQYIARLISEGKLKLSAKDLRVAYHDPCDLGRGTKEYTASRQILASGFHLLSQSFEKENSLCCGGSLGNSTLNAAQKAKIARKTAEQLSVPNPDYIVTSCPLCKKTLAKESEIPVLDIAELLVR